MFIFHNKSAPSISVSLDFSTGLALLFEHGRCRRDEQLRGCLLGDYDQAAWSRATAGDNASV